jgi:hypothetical protein
MKYFYLFYSLIASGAFCLDSATGSPQKYYSVRAIDFSENGFPKTMKIRLHGFSKAEDYPCQALVTLERQMLQGMRDFKVMEENNKQVVIEFTLDFEAYLPLKFFDSKNPEKWDLTPISGPRIPIKQGAAFVAIIKSERHLIGFVLENLTNDEFIREWRTHARAEHLEPANLQKKEASSPE